MCTEFSQYYVHVPIVIKQPKQVYHLCNNNHKKTDDTKTKQKGVGGGGGVRKMGELIERGSCVTIHTYSGTVVLSSKSDTHTHTHTHTQSCSNLLKCIYTHTHSHNSGTVALVP